jgi:hypothetical protein
LSYSVKNIWHRLDTCVLGQTWPPEFYSWIADSGIRSVFEKLAVETQEDHNNLEKLLISQGVTVFKPNIDFDKDHFLPPPMSPRDHMVMIDDTLYETWNFLYPSLTEPSTHINKPNFYNDIWNSIRTAGNNIVSTDQTYINGAMTYLFSDSLITSHWPGQNISEKNNFFKKISPFRKIKHFHLHGHIDGWFCPVTPGLILSSSDPSRQAMLDLFYKTYFPDWEVVYFEPSLASNYSFRSWAKDQTNSWWVPGQEHNTKFIEFVKNYYKHWVGSVYETVFEINMIVLDDKNIILSKPIDGLCKKMQEYGINIHVANLRHQNFWDAGLACSICEINRKE